jgi:hypothetical protein
MQPWRFEDAVTASILASAPGSRNGSAADFQPSDR